jgi:uncharacterized protein YkwD
MLRFAITAVFLVGAALQAESGFDQLVPSGSEPTETGVVSDSTTLLLIPPVSQDPDPKAPAILGPPTKQVPEDLVPTALEKQIFDLINQARANPGAFGYGSLTPVPALHWNAALLHIGRVHSQDMHEEDYFDHDSYDRVGGTLTLVSDWINRVKSVYPYNVRISENILMNSSGSAQEAAQGWMDSPPHRGNIMDNRLTEGPIGVYQGSRGTYWTNDFGGRSISYNLAISDLSFLPAAPQPGDSVQVRFKIHNSGQTDAFPVEVVLYRGNPLQGGTSITNVLTYPPILVKGNTRSVQSPELDTTGYPQDSEVYVLLDPLDKFPETTEADNIVHVPFFGSLPPPSSPTPTFTQAPFATPTQTPIVSQPTPTPTQTSIVVPPTPTPSIPVECVEAVRDGGFEDGSPYSEWQQSYDRYIVLYSYYQDGPLPYEGSNFCWFGGISDGIQETASIQQGVTLGVGNGQLSYYLRITSGLPTDFMRVLLDENELARYTGADSSGYGSYIRVAHNVSAYCDGGPHLLRFESTVTGKASFYLDNLSLIVCPRTTALGPRAEALFDFCHHWKVGLHGAGELLGIVRSLP